MLGDDSVLASARRARSADGLTLAAGSPLEASAATGIDGNQADDSAERAGAVYLFY